MRVLRAPPGAEARAGDVPCRFNGAPGMLLHEQGRLVTALSVSLVEGRVSAVYALRNPLELEAFAALRS